MEIIKFDPSIEELNKIVAVTSKITATDLSDDAQLAIVHDTRISLRDARVRIEKTGKEYRAEALAHQKAVIAREKELIAIIEPEEIRLKALEEQANTMKERAAREALLPMRKEQLAPFGAPTLTDESILDMDNDAFIVYLNERQAQKNEQDRLEIQAEKDRMAREAELKAAADTAALAERTRIEAQQKADEEARIEKAAQVKRDAELAAQQAKDEAAAEAARIVQAARDKVAQEAAQAEAAAREKAVREQQAKDEAAKKEQHAKYLEWATEMGWTQETADQYDARHTPAGIELWKRVGIYVASAEQ